jgi:hypothetical protein
MKLRNIAITALFASFAVAGCKSDAQKVCDHLKSLADKAGDEDPIAKKMAEEFKDSNKCVADVEKMQKEDAKAFDSAKTCILDADKLDAAIGCLFKAAMESKGGDAGGEGEKKE